MRNLDALKAGVSESTAASPSAVVPVSFSGTKRRGKFWLMVLAVPVLVVGALKLKAAYAGPTIIETGTPTPPTPSGVLNVLPSSSTRDAARSDLPSVRGVLGSRTFLDKNGATLDLSRGADYGDVAVGLSKGTGIVVELRPVANLIPYAAKAKGDDRGRSDKPATGRPAPGADGGAPGGVLPGAGNGALDRRNPESVSVPPAGRAPGR